MFVETMIIGRVGKIRMHESNGIKVANISVATFRKTKNVEETKWWDVSLWDQKADIVNSVDLKKGDVVMAKGFPDAIIYEKNGSPAIAYKLTANIFYKTGEARVQEGSEAPQENPTKQGASKKPWEK